MISRSRDRHDNRPIQSRQSTLSHGRDESRSKSNSWVIGVTITRLTIDQITDEMPNGHLETEVKVEIELEITKTTI